MNRREFGKLAAAAVMAIATPLKALAVVPAAPTPHNLAMLLAARRRDACQALAEDMQRAFFGPLSTYKG